MRKRGFDSPSVGHHVVVQGVAVGVAAGGAVGHETEGVIGGVGHPSGVEGFHCESEGSMRGALATTS